MLSLALLTGGCASQQVESAVVARVGSDELTVERLAQIVAASPDLPVHPEVVEGLALRWVEFSLFARRLAEGQDLMDSTAIVGAAWPDVQAAITRNFREARSGGGASPMPAQVDSVYAAGDVRLLRQILKRAPAGTSEERRDALRLEIEEIRRRLLEGGSWSEANRRNDDARARAVNGSIGLVLRGQTVPAFEEAAWALMPGELSEVVETEFGFHLIHRPTLQEVRPEFSAGVAEMWAQTADSAYEADLLERRGVSVREDMAEVRTAFASRLWRGDREHVLASYDGGVFTSGDFERYIRFLPPQFHFQAESAPDGELRSLVRSFVVRELTAEEARETGITLSTEQFREIATAYERQLQRVEGATGMTPDALEEGGESIPVVVDRFLERAAREGESRVTLPPGLAAYLLDAGDWEVSSEAVGVVVAEARSIRARARETTG